MRQNEADILLCFALLRFADIAVFTNWRFVETLRCQMMVNIFNNKLLKLRYVLIFRHNAIAHLIDYDIV